MTIDRVLVLAGVTLLSVAALTGFLQHKNRHDTQALADWRVVHNGGTAGAVQLLALGAVWSSFSDTFLSIPVAAGVTLATWTFFIGPLTRALGRPSWAARINVLGALMALPSYTLLPFLLIHD